MINVLESILGKNVFVIIDRPLGSFHPEHKDLIYPVNYGYIEGMIAPDGEEQDAYILGIKMPLKQFTGKVIAIIHRFNDVEDKLVVADENSNFTKEDIKNQVMFQEKYFDFEIIV
ncbi:MAG: inorganic pyrophosphatase [Eubacterium sp.]